MREADVPGLLGDMGEGGGCEGDTADSRVPIHAANNYRRQAAHAVVSPAEGTVRNKRQFYETKKEAAELAKEKGFRGFAVIPHPYRVTEAGKKLYRAENPDTGIWVWLRNEVEHREDYTYWSPHYHIIGMTTKDMEEAKDSDEMVYKMLRTFERFEGVRDADSHEDVYGAFRYLLSHTGYPEGSSRQVTTWHGDLANSVFVEDATEDWQNEKPCENVRENLKGEIEAVAGASSDEEGEGGSESDDREKCEVEGCDGVVIDVFDVSAHLRQCDPPPEIRRRMLAAKDWRLGEREPPAGLKRPQTEEQAREAFEVMAE
jgi:hypothetical protein